MNKSILMAALVLAAGFANAGDRWMVKLGVTDVKPTSSSSELTIPGVNNGEPVQATVGSDWEPSINLEYAFNKNWSVEVLAAAPFTHKVTIAGIENAARFKDLPPTVTAKYRYPMLPYHVVPYFGLGLNYTYIWGEQVNTTVSPALAAYTGSLKAKDSFGPAALIGLEYNFPHSNFGVAFDARWVYIRSELSYNGTNLGRLYVNPMVYTLGLTYKF